MANSTTRKREVGKTIGCEAQFTVWLPARDKAALQSMALASNVTVAELVRRLIKRTIAKNSILQDEEAA